MGGGCGLFVGCVLPVCICWSWLVLWVVVCSVGWTVCLLVGCVMCVVWCWWFVVVGWPVGVLVVGVAFGCCWTRLFVLLVLVMLLLLLLLKRYNLRNNCC